MNIVLAYLEVVLPYSILTMLLINRFRNKFKEICSNENDWAKEECEDIKTEITLSIVLSLIPLVNLLVLVFWFIRYVRECGDDTILKFVKDKLSICWNRLKNSISKIFIGK